MAANACRSFRKLSAFSPLPSIVVNAIVLCSRSRLKSMPVLSAIAPTAAIAPVAASAPNFSVLDSMFCNGSSPPLTNRRTPVSSAPISRRTWFSAPLAWLVA